MSRKKKLIVAIAIVVCLMSILSLSISQTTGQAFYPFFWTSQPLVLANTPTITLQPTCTEQCLGKYVAAQCLGNTQLKIDCFEQNAKCVMQQGVATCVPLSGCVPHCDGKVMVECINGYENRIDCATTFGGNGYTCRMTTSGPICSP